MGSLCLKYWSVHDRELKSLDNSILVSIYDSGIQEIAIDGRFANRTWGGDEWESDETEAIAIENLYYDTEDYPYAEGLMEELALRYKGKTIIIVENGGFYIKENEND